MTLETFFEKFDRFHDLVRVFRLLAERGQAGRLTHWQAAGRTVASRNVHEIRHVHGDVNIAIPVNIGLELRPNCTAVYWQTPGSLGSQLPGLSKC